MAKIISFGYDPNTNEPIDSRLHIVTSGNPYDYDWAANEDFYLGYPGMLLQIGSKLWMYHGPSNPTAAQLRIQTNWIDVTVHGGNVADEAAILDNSGTPELASGITAAEVRTLIGAGTSNLELGNTSTTALAGDTTTITSAQSTKLSGIAAGAEVNVQSNWTESDNNSDAFILNKPTDLTDLSQHDLSDLSDVDATAPTDHQVLSWDADNNRWEPTTLTAGDHFSITAGYGIRIDDNNEINVEASDDFDWTGDHTFATAPEFLNNAKLVKGSTSILDYEKTSSSTSNIGEILFRQGTTTEYTDPTPVGQLYLTPPGVAVTDYFYLLDVATDTDTINHDHGSNFSTPGAAWTTVKQIKSLGDDTTNIAGAVANLVNNRTVYVYIYDDASNYFYAEGFISNVEDSANMTSITIADGGIIASAGVVPSAGNIGISAADFDSASSTFTKFSNDGVNGSDDTDFDYAKILAGPKDNDADSVLNLDRKGQFTFVVADKDGSSAKTISREVLTIDNDGVDLTHGDYYTLNGDFESDSGNLIIGGTGRIVDLATTNTHEFVKASSDGTLSSTSLPAATSSAIGGIQLGFTNGDTATERQYALDLNSSNEAFVPIAYANAGLSGIVSTAAQTFAGVKTFSSTPIFSSNTITLGSTNLTETTLDNLNDIPTLPTDEAKYTLEATNTGWQWTVETADDDTDYVTLDTAQDITGLKTFDNSIIIRDESDGTGDKANQIRFIAQNDASTPEDVDFADIITHVQNDGDGNEVGGLKIRVRHDGYQPAVAQVTEIFPSGSGTVTITVFDVDGTSQTTNDITWTGVGSTDATSTINAINNDIDFVTADDSGGTNSATVTWNTPGAVTGGTHGITRNGGSGLILEATNGVEGVPVEDAIAINTSVTNVETAGFTDDDVTAALDIRTAHDDMHVIIDENGLYIPEGKTIGIYETGSNVLAVPEIWTEIKKGEVVLHSEASTPAEINTRIYGNKADNEEILHITALNSDSNNASELAQIVLEGDSLNSGSDQDGVIKFRVASSADDQNYVLDDDTDTVVTIADDANGFYVQGIPFTIDQAGPSDAFRIVGDAVNAPLMRTFADYTLADNDVTTIFDLFVSKNINNSDTVGALMLNHDTTDDTSEWIFTLGADANNQDRKLTIGENLVIVNSGDTEFNHSTEDDSRGPNINLYHNHTENGVATPGNDDAITADIAFASNFLNDTYGATETPADNQIQFFAGPPSAANLNGNYFLFTGGEVTNFTKDVDTLTDAIVRDDTLWVNGRQILASGDDATHLFGSAAVGDTIYIYIYEDSSNYMYAEWEVTAVESDTQWAAATRTDYISARGNMPASDVIIQGSGADTIYENDGVDSSTDAGLRMATIEGQSLSVRRGNDRGWRSALDFNLMRDVTDGSEDPTRVLQLGPQQATFDTGVYIQPDDDPSNGVLRVRGKGTDGDVNYTTELLWARTPTSSTDAYVQTDVPFRLGRYTTTERGNIDGPQEGQIIFNQTTEAINVYSDGSWNAVGSGGGGSDFDGGTISQDIRIKNSSAAYVLEDEPTSNLGVDDATIGEINFIGQDNTLTDNEVEYAVIRAISSYTSTQDEGHSGRLDLRVRAGNGSNDYWDALKIDARQANGQAFDRILTLGQSSGDIAKSLGAFVASNSITVESGGIDIQGGGLSVTSGNVDFDNNLNVDGNLTLDGDLTFGTTAPTYATATDGDATTTSDLHPDFLVDNGLYWYGGSSSSYNQYFLDRTGDQDGWTNADLAWQEIYTSNLFSATNTEHDNSDEGYDYNKKKHFTVNHDTHAEVNQSNEVYGLNRASHNFSHIIHKTRTHQTSTAFTVEYNTDNDEDFTVSTDRLLNVEQGNTWALTYSEIILAGRATGNSGTLTDGSVTRNWDEYLYLDGHTYYRVYAVDNESDTDWNFTENSNNTYYSEQIWDQNTKSGRTIIANRL